MLPKRVYLSLGSNLGEREENLRRALEALAQHDIEILAQSSIYGTEPQDFPNQRWFLNMVVACETRLLPLQLLRTVQQIERDLGRTRNAVHKGPRTIDIDILLFGATTMKTTPLTIPHARMFDRRFVLVPLLEIAPAMRHPTTGEPLTTYLGRVATQRLRKLQTNLDHRNPAPTHEHLETESEA